jgi:hypothetical protein
MPTYKNCHELVREVRQGLNEYDDALASGDDNVGAFRNDYIITQINNTIKELFALIAKRRPSEFTKQSSVTPIDSTITLPADYGKLILLRDQYGQRVYPIDQQERRLNDARGSERLYYMQGRTIVLDQAGITTPYSLIYKTKPRNIHMGRASAGGVNSITLDAKHAPKITDYFNGMILECVNGDWFSTVSAYTSARVATIAGTAAAADLYGLVPEIPDWAHALIAPKALIACKIHPVSKEKLTKNEMAAYQDLFLSLFRENATPTNDDTDWEEMFTSFEPKAGGVIF